MWLGPSLPRARTVLPAGTWDAGAADVITLDFEQRHRRRVRMTSDSGMAFLLDLPQATMLRDGDGLPLDNGKQVAVRAAAETLLDVRCDTPTELARIAWHLGNRHLSVQVLPSGEQPASGGTALRLRDDYVIADMLRHLGASVTIVQAPFDPESGAYTSHSHDHGHAHDHD